MMNEPVSTVEVGEHLALSDPVKVKVEEQKPEAI
eukprot:CAMPEP_0173325326 /NCGR_PEP_ID=MMETSP1144-20121109/445_1 /TAXON_ID=483371 /ORGANISM="non described non described, Strain CCMP2298" /LENGTH=33 /DNA_ID= /DNA_START= /DNA_END= /DNA_ORIENTATION=